MIVGCLLVAASMVQTQKIKHLDYEANIGVFTNAAIVIYGQHSGLGELVAAGGDGPDEKGGAAVAFTFAAFNTIP